MSGASSIRGVEQLSLKNIPAPLLQIIGGIAVPPGEADAYLQYLQEERMKKEGIREVPVM
jgi:hypothetical protein